MTNYGILIYPILSGVIPVLVTVKRRILAVPVTAMKMSC